MNYAVFDKKLDPHPSHLACLSMIFFRKKKRRPQEDGFEAALRLGNAANGGKRWSEAAEHYAKALDIRPADTAIRVQLGHALKEQQLLERARGAYSQAVADAPLDADAYLHLGHVSKMMGNIAAAISAYQDAARLGSTGMVGKDARRELAALKADVPVIVEFDLTGLEEERYSELVNALKACRWEQVLGIIDHFEPLSSHIKLVKAQVYQILQRYEEALLVYSDKALLVPGSLSCKALRVLYRELGEDEKADLSLKIELRDSMARALPFSIQADLVGELAARGDLVDAFEVGDVLFAIHGDVEAPRTAADAKRRRVSRLLSPQLSAELRKDFLARSTSLKDCGELPQAVLLNDEALALKI